MAITPQQATRSTTPLSSGMVVGGKYRLDTVIGRGGFATVYRATHVEIASLRVAVKVLLADSEASAHVIERFRREASTVATLQDPRTVRVIDFGMTNDGRPFLVMEYIDGPSLHAVIQRDGTLATAHVARVATDILCALEEAHLHGIIHRDIKPENVLFSMPRLGASPMARVVDFGIAKALNSNEHRATSTANNRVVCTPQYAAPELLLGNPSPASDLYALGHTMVEMLTGTTAYAALGNRMLISSAQVDVHSPVPLPQEIVEGPLGAVVVRALQKPQERRYATAMQMRLELDAAMRAIRASEGPRRPLDVSRFASDDPACQQADTIAVSSVTTGQPTLFHDQTAHRTDSAAWRALGVSTGATAAQERRRDRIFQGLLLLFLAALVTVIGVVGWRAAAALSNAQPAIADAPRYTPAPGPSVHEVARWRVNEAARMGPRDTLTLSTALDGAEIWYDGARVAALPVSALYAGSRRPLTLEVRAADGTSWPLRFGSGELLTRDVTAPVVAVAPLPAERSTSPRPTRAPGEARQPQRDNGHANDAPPPPAPAPSFEIRRSDLRDPFAREP